MFLHLNLVFLQVADIPLDHPSCSKQHSALQYRLVSYTREDGTTGKLDYRTGSLLINRTLQYSVLH